MLNQEASRTPSSQGDPGSANQGAFSQWQPISTAPTDGTPVRVTGPDPMHGSYTGPARLERGYWRKMHRQGFLNMTAYPTHWMPLPAPPATP